VYDRYCSSCKARLFNPRRAHFRVGQCNFCGGYCCRSEGCSRVWTRSDYILPTVKRLTTDTNSVTLCTIHQPNYQTISQFDKLLLLGGGRTLFFGPVRMYNNPFNHLSILTLNLPLQIRRTRNVFRILRLSHRRTHKPNGLRNVSNQHRFHVLHLRAPIKRSYSITIRYFRRSMGIERK
jgi:hypothetical protein